MKTNIKTNIHMHGDRILRVISWKRTVTWWTGGFTRISNTCKINTDTNLDTDMDTDMDTDG